MTPHPGANASRPKQSLLARARMRLAFKKVMRAHEPSRLAHVRMMLSPSRKALAESRTMLSVVRNALSSARTESADQFAEHAVSAASGADSIRSCVVS